jgi:hypothetical protein
MRAFCSSNAARAFSASSSAIKFAAALDCSIYVFVQGELLEILTALFRVMLACVINQQAAHDLIGNAEQMRPVLPVHARLIH